MKLAFHTSFKTSLKCVRQLHLNYYKLKKFVDICLETYSSSSGFPHVVKNRLKKNKAALINDYVLILSFGLESGKAVVLSRFEYIYSTFL
jgi:hypothetical protein